MAAGLVPGRRANFAPRRRRSSGSSVRAAPPPRQPRRPRPPPWLRPPRPALPPWSHPAPPPLNFSALAAPPPSASVPGPTPGCEARAPLGRLRPRGSPRSLPLPAPPLCVRVSSSPRTPRGRCARAGAGLLPGPASPCSRPGRHHPGQFGQSGEARGRMGELRRG